MPLECICVTRMSSSLLTFTSCYFIRLKCFRGLSEKEIKTRLREDAATPAFHPPESSIRCEPAWPNPQDSCACSGGRQRRNGEAAAPPPASGPGDKMPP